MTWPQVMPNLITYEEWCLSALRHLALGIARRPSIHVELRRAPGDTLSAGVRRHHHWW
jgi:hypothetical protein